MSDLILYLGVTALTLLIFTLGHYCIIKNKREGHLLAKVNHLERRLMASSKECEIIKSELVDARGILASIQDNSFGSNEMVISLKRELHDCEAMKQELEDQNAALEKELENAAEAGLELNKMVAELLSNQNGSESIISSVEELQRQLNEQQATILSINTSLAEKSRENSELQIVLGEQNERYNSDVIELQKQLEELKIDKLSVEANLHQIQSEYETKIKDLLQVTIDCDFLQELLIL